MKNFWSSQKQSKNGIEKSQKHVRRDNGVDREENESDLYSFYLILVWKIRLVSKKEIHDNGNEYI